MNDKFDLLSLATNGIVHSVQYVQLSDGSIIKLRLFDTAGQENYNALTENYYKKADCCLLVYDITKRSSFDKIKNYYIKKIKDNCTSILKVVLLGNKADLKDQRKVDDFEGANLALENGYVFMESSCKDNYNVSDAFTTLVEMINKELIATNKITNFALMRDNKKNYSCC